MRRARRCLLVASAVLGVSAAPACSSTSSRDESAASPRAATRPRLAAAPVAVKAGTTFEVRVRFREALPTNADRTGADAEFLLGPSATDHAPVRMRGSHGFCYRQTLYNDFDEAVLRKAHAGSTLTLRIVVHRRPPAIVRRVKLAANRDAVPPGCVLPQQRTS